MKATEIKVKVQIKTCFPQKKRFFPKNKMIGLMFIWEFVLESKSTNFKETLYLHLPLT